MPADPSIAPQVLLSHRFWERHYDKPPWWHRQEEPSFSATDRLYFQGQDPYFTSLGAMFFAAPVLSAATLTARLIWPLAVVCHIHTGQTQYRLSSSEVHEVWKGTAFSYHPTLASPGRGREENTPTVRSLEDLVMHISMCPYIQGTASQTSSTVWVMQSRSPLLPASSPRSPS